MGPSSEVRLVGLGPEREVDIVVAGMSIGMLTPTGMTLAGKDAAFALSFSSRSFFFNSTRSCSSVFRRLHRSCRGNSTAVETVAMLVEVVVGVVVSDSR